MCARTHGVGFLPQGLGGQSRGAHWGRTSRGGGERSFDERGETQKLKGGEEKDEVMRPARPVSRALGNIQRSPTFRARGEASGQGDQVSIL